MSSSALSSGLCARSPPARRQLPPRACLSRRAALQDILHAAAALPAPQSLASQARRGGGDAASRARRPRGGNMEHRFELHRRAPISVPRPSAALQARARRPPRASGTECPRRALGASEVMSAHGAARGRPALAGGVASDGGPRAPPPMALAPWRGVAGAPSRLCSSGLSAPRAFAPHAVANPNCPLSAAHTARSGPGRALRKLYIATSRILTKLPCQWKGGEHARICGKNVFCFRSRAVALAVVSQRPALASAQACSAESAAALVYATLLHPRGGGLATRSHRAGSSRFS